MNYYIDYTKDVMKNHYLAIKFSQNIVDPFLTELKKIENNYEEYTENQRKRDGNSYHITVVNAIEYNKLLKEMGPENLVNSLDNIFKYPIDDLKMMGVGSASKNENKAYFVVCKSEKLDAVRKRFNLPEKDFHITLGFKFKDVFGVRKNKVIDKKSDFLKHLSKKFYENENFNFVKKIKNFKLNKDLDIIPVEINETTAKFMVGDYYIEVSYLDDHGFNILSKYLIDKKLPKLSQTEIAKKLT